MSPGELSRSGSPSTSRSRSLVTAKPWLANERRGAREKAAGVPLRAVRPGDRRTAGEQAEADRTRAARRSQPGRSCRRLGDGATPWIGGHDLTPLPRYSRHRTAWSPRSTTAPGAGPILIDTSPGSHDPHRKPSVSPPIGPWFLHKGSLSAAATKPIGVRRAVMLASPRPAPILPVAPVDAVLRHVGANGEPDRGIEVLLADLLHQAVAA